MHHSTKVQFYVSYFKCNLLILFFIIIYHCIEIKLSLQYLYLVSSLTRNKIKFKFTESEYCTTSNYVIETNNM